MSAWKWWQQSYCLCTDFAFRISPTTSSMHTFLDYEVMSPFFIHSVKKYLVFLRARVGGLSLGAWSKESEKESVCVWEYERSWPIELKESERRKWRKRRKKQPVPKPTAHVILGLGSWCKKKGAMLFGLNTQCGTWNCKKGRCVDVWPQASHYVKR